MMTTLYIRSDPVDQLEMCKAGSGFPSFSSQSVMHAHCPGKNDTIAEVSFSIDRDQDAKALPLEQLCQLMILTVYTSFLVRRGMVRLVCHMLTCYVSVRSLIQRLGLGQALTRSRPMNS